MDRVPQIIDDNVKRLIKRINTTEIPIYLDVTPESYAEINNCFPAVKQKIEKDGGSLQLGWQIWQTLNIMIEAEFHAVWKSPDGTLKDITPKSENIRRILFVPDSEAKYDGAQRDNIRMNISNNNLFNDFNRICKAIHKLMNKGDRAYKSGFIEQSDEEYEFYQNLNNAKNLVLNMIISGSSRNSPCFCGSGEKYKHCHEKLLFKLLYHNY